MGVEIERKFLVTASTWRQSARSGLRFSQGYVYRGDAQVRVRVAGRRGFLTVKGPRRGISRSEYEYEIPLLDAEEMLRELCRPPILEKVRYEVRHGQHLWEVDVYDGEDAGIVLAEIELSRPDEVFDLPDWVGPEVTGNPDFGHERFTRGRSFAALGSRTRGLR